MQLKYHRNLFVIIAADAFLIFLSIFLAFQIRFDFNVDHKEFAFFWQFLPYVIIIKLTSFWIMELYRGMWRYTSINSLINVIKAVIGSSVAIVLLVLWKYRFYGISRSVFLIDLFLTILFVAGFRVFIRLCYERIPPKTSIGELVELIGRKLMRNSDNAKRLLIIGAGDCAEKIFREIKANHRIKYDVVGFLDDDLEKHGRKIHGIPVIDKIDQVANVVNALEVAEIVIAMPSISAKRMREIVDLCKATGIKFNTVPNMGELINGQVTVDSIRKVEYRDLLGRQPAKLDEEKIDQFIGEKTVMVTGASGSIGKGLCRQICRFKPERIILFERAESPLYEIDLELKKNFSYISIIPVLGDIQSKNELEDVFRTYTPSIVFHAAAYKHVPMLEEHPWKAVENNIIGTENLVDVAERFGCEKFVFISTDKAVNPTNVMGTSKRISEMIVQNRNIFTQSKTHFVTVRFGNVIGSAGSVIPLFKKQIKEGGPVTVTHPDIIRYFMLIPEACQLILQAGVMGKGGEIFVLEMGKPVKILDVAKDLIRLSGLEPDIDIKIEFTGLRPGEKLYEELMTADENVIPTDHEKILIFNSSKIDMEELNARLDALKNCARQRNAEAIRQLMKEIVPEYNHDCLSDKRQFASKNNPN